MSNVPILTPCTIDAQTPNGVVKVNGECSTTGLSIHKALDGSKAWMILHVQSGLAFPFFKLYTRDAAVRVLAKLESFTTDWHRDWATLNLDVKLMRKVRRLARKENGYG